MGNGTLVFGDLVRGGLAGAAGTWVMDQVTTAMASAQSADITAQEERAQPNGQSSIANLVDRVASATATELSDEQKSRVSQVVHYGLGVVPGAIFGVLRRRLPLVGAAGGLFYGFLVWALNDEYLNTQLGLSAAPDAYPPETHWRGLVGHLVLGATTNSGIDALGG